jgi:hypothetical protein
MMHTITVKIPERMFTKAQKVAESKHISVEQLLTEQFYASVESYWEERSKEVSRADFDAVLQRIPKGEPEEFDRL